MKHHFGLCRAMTGASALTALTGALLAGTAASAADVTYERLLNPEPQNWLSHHRDYNAQRYSPLDAINKSNIKNLKLAVRGAARWQVGGRKHRSDAAGRRRLHVHRR